MIRNMRSHTKLLFTLFLTATHLSHPDQKEVRHLTPPNIQEDHLGAHVLCHRPMRHGSPDMSIKTIKDEQNPSQLKVIATNAGHGGSGWTYAPGCATHVNSMLINSPQAQNLTTDTPITIIGAGIMGLFASYDLLKRGYKNITIVADEFNDLTSHRASGLLAPSSMDNDPEKQAILDKIGLEAYTFYADIANDKIPEFHGGARILPAYLDHNDKRLDPYVGKVIQPAKAVTVDFGNGTTRDMIVYDDGIFMNSTVMMKRLQTYVQDKVTLKQEKIMNFSEIPTQFIINCTGLGAQELNHDDAYISVQGHIIELEDQDPQTLNYLLSVPCESGVTEEGFESKRFCSIAPKKSGVISGTFIKGATQETPNYQEFEIVVKNVREFFGIKD